MDIVGLGTVAMDVLLEVDTLPKEDGFAVVKRRSYLPGGSGTNVIVQAARLGAESGFVAQLGDDQLGSEIRASLAAEGVDSSGLVVKKGGTSLHTEIVVDEEGKKFILLDLGDAFLGLDQASVKASYVTGAKVFYTDLLPGGPAIAALKEAKRAGLTTVFNMQVGLAQMEGFGVSKKSLLDALAYVDVFAPCRDGLEALTGQKDVNEAAKALKAHFGKLLLVTLGGEGSVAFDGPSETRVPIRKVEVKDTTGAGDSYIGAFMVARFLRGLDLRASMAFATAAAAYTCMGLGARSSPTSAELDAFIAR
jgi:sugar/nucleoside kinase (ribokinase family)